MICPACGGNRHSGFYAISPDHIEQDTIKSFGANNIRVISENEACPIGLNKNECENCWRNISGFDMYAYKDIGEVRVYLSRMYKGVYLQNRNAYSENVEISYEKVVNMLEEDGVIELISESPNEVEEPLELKEGMVIVKNDCWRGKETKLISVKLI